MFYSGSSTWGDTYAVGVARAKSMAGPWEKMGLPLAHSNPAYNTTNTTFVSPGHNSVAHVAAENSSYLVYHANKWGDIGTNCLRYLMLDRLVWSDDGWPALATANGAPSTTPQPTP
jgi:beta-xylosidase